MIPRIIHLDNMDQKLDKDIISKSQGMFRKSTGLIPCFDQRLYFSQMLHSLRGVLNCLF